MADKAAGAFLTIGELADRLGVPHHVLRYWETRFPQLRPLQRSGRRRYYRPEDVVLAERIQRLLQHEGYTVKGVQQLLASSAPALPPSPETAASEGPTSEDRSPMMRSLDEATLVRLQSVRDRLAAALASG